MNHYPQSIRNAISQLVRLPGIGQRTAERLAMHLLRSTEKDVNNLARSLVDLKKQTMLCSKCYTLSDGALCQICRDPSRNQTLLCVVEGPAEMMAVEKTGAYSGLYHVLHGVLSPMDGIGPDDIRINELIRRLERDTITEVILATSTQVEGEATASFLAELLTPYHHITVTRIASGMPVGGDLKYTDPVTLKNAMEKRHAI
jgi:recombination protein RecR